MQRHYRNIRLLETASFIVICLYSANSLASPEVDKASYEETIVTAQKRTESIQNVPISISAFNTDSITQQGIDNALELAFHIPNIFSDKQAAPLLCSGAIGYRALKLTNIRDGDLLGLTGFGGSAHLVLQLTRYMYPNSKVFVFARDQATRDFALELGAVWAGDTTERSPQALDAIIDTTPAWKPVVEALKNLRPAGRLVVNAIRKEDADKDYLLNLSYHEHLWMEKEIKTVANITREDITEFLPLAAAIPIKPEVTTYALEEANQALLELKHNTVKGAKVLLM